MKINVIFRDKDLTSEEFDNNIIPVKIVKETMIQDIKFQILSKILSENLDEFSKLTEIDKLYSDINKEENIRTIFFC